MNQNKSELLTKIKSLFYKNNQHVRKYLIEELYNNKKMSRIDFLNIWNNPEELDNLDEVVLCALTLELSQLIGYAEDINISDYFTDVEIQNAKNYIVPVKDVITYPITFENVFKLSPNVYLTHVNIKTLAKLQESKLLVREVNAQRETIVRKVGSSTVEYLKTYSKTIREIKQKLLDGDYTPDQIYFNVNDNGDMEIEYDDSENTLVIKNGVISLIEGNHRILAIEEAVNVNPNLNINFPVIISTLPLKQAQDIIVQLEKKNPILKRKVKSMENTSNNDVVRKIIQSNDLSSVYKNKIVTIAEELTNGFGYLVFSDLSDAIKDCYSKEDLEFYQEETVDWLVKYLNAVAFVMKKYFNDFNYRKKTWICKPIFSRFIILLSKELKGLDNWKEKLVDVLSNIDFDLQDGVNYNSKKFADNLILNVKES